MALYNVHYLTYLTHPIEGCFLRLRLEGSHLGTYLGSTSGSTLSPVTKVSWACGGLGLRLLLISSW